MASDSMYEQEYKCPSCGEIQKHYVWSSELDIATHKCKCGDVVTISDVHDKPIVETFRVGRKMDDAAIKADRRKRASLHFKNEVMPTIGGKDKKYFEKKIYKK